MARPRSEAARQKVIQAAQAVIAELGVEAFSVDEVAKRSGVAKTTIYRHWESANHLLLSIMDQVADTFPTPNTGSLRNDLISLFQAHCEMADDPAMHRMILGLLARSVQDEAFRTLKNDFVAERHQPLRTVLELARARGELDADLDLDIAADMVEGPLAVRSLLKGVPIQPNEIPQYVDAVLAGLLHRDD